VISHLIQILEQIGIQNLLTISAIESFYVSILIGFSGFDVPQLNFILFAPLGKYLADEFRSIIASDGIE
jgi:hypothetical protein